MVRQEPHPTPLNIVAMSNALETNGRVRLLPSLRRNGLAGASPSRAMNGLGKVEENMFRGVASPSRACSPDQLNGCLAPQVERIAAFCFCLGKILGRIVL